MIRQGRRELIGIFCDSLRTSLRESGASWYLSHGKLQDLDIGFYGIGSESGQLKPVTVLHIVDKCIGACVQRPREGKGDFQRRLENVRRIVSDQYPDQEGWQLLSGAVRNSLKYNWKGIWMSGIHSIGEKS